MKSLLSVLIALVPALALVGFWGLTEPFWWVALAWVSGSVIWGGIAHRELLGRLYRPWILDIAAVSLLAVLAFALMPEVAAGHRPVEHDHTVHFYKAWNFWENFVLEGRLHGWSHRWFAGYPAHYLYPVGTEIWIHCVRILSLGMLSVSSAYAVAFYLFFVLKGVALYALGRSTVGPLAGLLAGIVYLGDTGAFRLGGWVYTATWGVWPQGLSIVFALFALALLRRVLQTRALLPVVGFGVLMAAALITHPIQIFFFAVVAGVLPVAMWTSEDLDRTRLSASLRVGLSYAIGGLLSAFWLLPFLSGSEFSAKYGAPWRTLYETGVSVYDGGFLAGSWSVFVTLGVLGVVGLLLSRDAHKSLIGLVVLVLVSVSSTTVLAEFRLVELSESFWFVQWQRFSMLIKPLVFLAGGWVVVEFVRHVAGAWSDRGQDASRVFTVVALGVPILFGLLGTVVYQNFDRSLMVEKDRPRIDAYEAFEKWAQNAWEERDVEFFRVAAYATRNDHSWVDLGARIPMPLYKTGFMPAAVYTYKMQSRDARVFEALNVRYVLSPRRLGKREYELVEDFGQSTYLYELKSWTPDPFVLEGTGDVELLTWSDELIELEASPGSEGQLRLNVSYFDRWHAYRDGEEVAIGTTSIEEEPDHTGFMTVDLSPGTYRFVFERGAPEIWGWILFFVGLMLALFLVLLHCGRPSKVRTINGFIVDMFEWVDAFEDWQYRRLKRVAMGVYAGVVLGALAFAMLPAQASVDEGSVEFDFLDALHEASVSRGQSQCPRVLGRHICAKEEYKQVYSTFAEVDREWKRCIWAHPPGSNEPLRLSFTDVPRGRRVAGWFGVARTGETRSAPGVDFEVAIDGVEAYSGKTREDNTVFEFDVETPQTSSTMDVQFVVKAAKSGRRHFCFRAQVLE